MTLFSSRLALAAILLSCSLSSLAQSAVSATGAPVADSPAASAPGWFSSTYDSAENNLEHLYDDGRLSLILSGYTYHDRHTYSAAKIATLNEKAWGLGTSKELRDAKDNEESIQFLIISDSHFRPQISATYAYQWMANLSGNWELGAGYNAGLVSRTDIFNSKPVPGILPMFSIGTRDTKVFMTYVPHLSGTVNGNVLYFNLRMNLK